jgi:hypothetical protein
MLYDIVAHPVTKIMCHSSSSLIFFPLYCPENWLVMLPLVLFFSELWKTCKHIFCPFNICSWQGLQKGVYIEVRVKAICCLKLLEIAYRANYLTRRNRRRRFLSPSDSEFGCSCFLRTFDAKLSLTS